jgi:tRNA modification GTPase
VVDPLETIVAIATSRRGAARGIVRMSGPQAWQIVEPLFNSPFPNTTGDTAPRALVGTLSRPPVTAPLPATLFLSRAPRSFTGQDLVELHTIGSPPVLELTLSTFLARGARLALPGEFTMRAFLSGKLDLTEAEAILGLIDATNAKQADAALRQMAGGIARPIGQLRDRLLDLLAALEAGLDFAEEDLEFIDRRELRSVLETAVAQLHALSGQLEGRLLGVDRLRAVLTGPPNAGKSSLFNALLGRDAALVGQSAGTTRDYLVGELELTHDSIELADTAGIEAAADILSHHAQRSREQAADGADLLLWCVESTNPNADIGLPPSNLASHAGVLVIHTKCDLVEHQSRTADRDSASDDWAASIDNRKPEIKRLFVSAHTGAGLAELRRCIEEWSSTSREPDTTVVGTTAARCRHSISGAQAAATRALAALNAKADDDLIALELRLALDELAQVVGAVYTDDILDRIFTRFCIGK